MDGYDFKNSSYGINLETLKHFNFLSFYDDLGHKEIILSLSLVWGNIL